MKNAFIFGNQNQPLNLSLSHKHAIKRVSMVLGQHTSLFCVNKIDGQRKKTLADNHLTHRQIRQLELAYALRNPVRLAIYLKNLILLRE